MATHKYDSWCLKLYFYVEVLSIYDHFRQNDSLSLFYIILNRVDYYKNMNCGKFLWAFFISRYDFSRYN